MRKLKLHELGRSSLAEYQKQEKTRITLVLDNIRSAMNVGSFFRTADAFALEKIILCGITAQPPHREINKTAIGADQSVEWSYEKDIHAAVTKLKEEGYHLAGVEQTDESQYLQRFSPDLKRPYALIFGNEVNGLYRWNPAYIG
jgi:23S rRNA (guanosine2251-2'-O)-methyltransferase